MASKQKRKTTPRKAAPGKAKKETISTEEESDVQQQEAAEIEMDTQQTSDKAKQTDSGENAEAETKENGDDEKVEDVKEAGIETGDTEAENLEKEVAKEAEEEAEEAEEEPEVDEDGNVVEIQDDDDDDVIIIKEDGPQDKGKQDKKKEEKEASWVDIIEREKDGKMHAELSKIRKLITAGQKGKEIQDLARTHRVHMFPVYPEDLVDPFVMEIMKNCTQTKVTFCCRKTDDGNKKFCGFMELSFVRLKFLDENKEKLTTIRDDIKFKIAAQRTAVDDFTNDWIVAAGLPENADTNNRLTLFAPSLPPSVTVEELWELFGRAREIWLVPGEPRQHAYIKFANEDLLQATLKDLKERGPPRADFNFCRLVRFYDVQRVIRTQGNMRHRRDSGPLGRRGSGGILSTRGRDQSRGSRRSSPPRAKVATLGSKDEKNASTSKTSDADKKQTSEKSAPEKAKSETRKSSEKEKEAKRSRSKDRDTKSRDRGRARSPRDRDRDRDRNRRNPIPSRSADRLRQGPDRLRRPPADRPVRRFHDDRMGSILGEPPVPSLMGPPMMNNTPLERSLNQLQMPMQAQMPMQPPPHMPMHRDEVPQQQGLQVLDSLLSTLGQLSHHGDNPIETLAQALHSPQGYNEPPRRHHHDDRGYGDDRQGRSPMKRPVSPMDSAPLGDVDMKRRRDTRPVADVGREAARDYPHNLPRDFNAPARPGGGMVDAGYKPTPSRPVTDTVSPTRRVEYSGDYQRRAASTAAPARNFDSARPGDAMDNYDGPARLPRTTSYEERHAQASGEIARMESEYARLMDQIGQQQPNTQRPSAASYGQPSYY